MLLITGLILYYLKKYIFRIKTGIACLPEGDFAINRY